jgi:tetratricopeptide (TPR) repeat protein
MTARSPFACLAAVLLTLLAVALGGSVDLPAQAILAALAGLLLLIAPPRAALRRAPLLIAGALLLIALAAFLPGTGSHPAWRDYLAHECHLPSEIPLERTLASHAAVEAFPLDNTRSPQPWLTLQGCGLLILGGVWGLYLLAQPWEREDRIRAAQLLVFGVAFLALVAVLAFTLHFHVPGWTQEQNRGWFPNRNQTADVLALTGIVNYALIFDRLRKGKRIGYFLLLALLPIVVELVISYSRAGILLFFGGVLLWHLWPRPRQSRLRSSSIKWLALSAALGIVLVAVFLAWGGSTLSRFQEQPTADATASDFSDFRGAIQLDALRFSTESPVLGVGLGNFEPLFSFSRVAAINGNRAIHPESDWLWIACEMGWPAVMFLVAGYLWWLRRALPLENKSGESTRRALIVAILVFAVHGFVDVSGHRTGSLWVALLIAGLALPTRGALTPSRTAPVVFRAFGALLLLLAAWWGASLAGYSTPPTTATLARLKAEIANPAQTPNSIVHDADAALLIAPLDWSLYFNRGQAEVALPDDVDSAVADFTTARALNPYWIELTINEGLAWSAAGQPDYAIDAWRDGLRRAGPLAHEAYRQMTGLVQRQTVERRGLADMAADNIDYLLLLLPNSFPDEADDLTAHLLQTDPNLHTLSAAQRGQLFEAWWKQGNQERMMQLIREHPEWDGQTWLYQAQFAAKENDFQRACEIAARNVQPPIVPQSIGGRPLDAMASDFAAHPDNLSDGLMLLLAQMKTGDNDAALDTLQLLMKIPDHPRYLAYIGAELYGGKGDWPQAWAAWQTYLQP